MIYYIPKVFRADGKGRNSRIYQNFFVCLNICIYIVRFQICHVCQKYISNICPIHKTGGKKIINNYRPVSLLPICGKIFQRLIFNSLFEYLQKCKLEPMILV